MDAILSEVDNSSAPIAPSQAFCAVDISSPELSEAHPGSPVDFSGKRRPSLAATMAAQRSTFHAQLRGSRIGDENGDVLFTKDVVVAKQMCACELSDDKGKIQTRLQSAAIQPFFIPAKVPEQYEMQYPPSPEEDGMSLDSIVEDSLEFDFQEANGVWISATPRACAPQSTTSMIHSNNGPNLDVSCQHTMPYSDTDITSSCGSIRSASGSLLSGTTTCSDIYGWEEELDRKSSMEVCTPQIRSLQRRLPSGGRPFISPENPTSQHNLGKRRGLLHRVLHISRRDTGDSPSSTKPLVYTSSMN